MLAVSNEYTVLRLSYLISSSYQPSSQLHRIQLVLLLLIPTLMIIPPDDIGRVEMVQKRGLPVTYRTAAAQFNAQWRRNRGSGGSMNRGPRAHGPPRSGATEKF